MAAVCQVTGAVPGFGHSISHSHRRTKRRFDPKCRRRRTTCRRFGRNVTLHAVAPRGSRSLTRVASSPSSRTPGRGEKI